jgi:serine/threonine-protein kinase
MASRVQDPFGLVGQVIDGRYRIQQVVGQGGFGVVYRAFHLLLDGPVAIKLLKMPADADAPTREALVASFKREGRILFELCALHHSIVQVTDTGIVQLEGRGAAPYLVLEWLDGVALNRALEQRARSALGPMTFEQAFCLLRPVAEALDAAHSKGIAHRDVKPGNIFLARVGSIIVPKLLDFGIAKVVRDAATTAEMFEATSQGGPFTALYGAPEQWVKRLGATGTWTDVYAFALVFSELLTGRSPVEGGDALQAMGAALDAGLRPTPNSRGASIPDNVEAVFLRALSVDPRTRSRTVGEFWSCLSEAAGNGNGAVSGRILAAEWDLPGIDEDPHHSPSCQVVHAPRPGSTLPTENETTRPPASGTGGPVVSAMVPSEGLRPSLRPNLLRTIAAATAAAAIASAGWAMCRPILHAPEHNANRSPIARPAASLIDATIAPADTALDQKSPVEAVSAPPTKTTKARTPIAVRPIATSTPSPSGSIPAAATASQSTEPTAEEILKSRR